MLNFKPKENTFFVFFNEAATNCYEAALALNDLINNYSGIESKINGIEALEHKGDDISHKIITLLKKSFITPIDKEDIYMLTNILDNIVDNIQAAAFRFEMLNISIITDEIKIQTGLIVKCTQKLPELMKGLQNLRNSNDLKKIIIEINSIEDEGDEVFRKTIKKLFRSDLQDGDKFKLKEIYEYLEDVIDICEDLGDKVEEVIMKHA